MKPTHPQDGKPVVIYGRRGADPRTDTDCSACTLLTRDEALAAHRVGLPLLCRTHDGAWVGLGADEPWSFPVSATPGKHWRYSTYPRVPGED